MITVATYNILHGYYAQTILEDLKLMIDRGVDVFCLQEADLPFEQPLHTLLVGDHFKNWQVDYAHAGVGVNLALLWNTSRLRVEKFHTTIFPPLPKPDLLQWLKGVKETLHRGALSGYFLVDGKTVRITSVHLAWEGGIKHRLAQLAQLKAELAAESVDFDIIGGDFNTMAPSSLRRFQQKKVEAALGQEYVDVLPHLHWSEDQSFIAPQDHWERTVKVLKFFHLKWRARLDYLFARNLKVVSAEMLDLPGSDHRPLIAKLSF